MSKGDPRPHAPPSQEAPAIAAEFVTTWNTMAIQLREAIQREEIARADAKQAEAQTVRAIARINKLERLAAENESRRLFIIERGKDVAGYLDRAERLEAALRELVACKDLIDSIPDSWQVTEIEHHETHGPRYADYKRRKPIAWESARTALARPFAATP